MLQNYNKAHLAYEKLLPCFSKELNNAAWHILMTDIELKRGFVSEAGNHLDNAMICDKDSAWGYLTYCWEEDSTRAIKLYNAWADVLADKNTNISQDELNLILMSYTDREKYGEMVKLYEKKKAFYSDYAPLLLCASNAYVEAQELEKAIDVFGEFTKVFKSTDNTFGEYYPYTIDEEVVELVSNNILLCKSVLFIESNNFDSALVILNALPAEILIEDILPYSIFLNKVNKYYDKALQHCNQLINLSPSADAYTQRGWIYYHMGMFEKAKKDFQKVLDMESDSVITWNSAEAYYYLGEKKLAKKTAKELLSSDTLSFYDYWMSSLFYETIGNERKAVKLFKEALRKEHDHDIYPIVIISYETSSVKKKVEEIVKNE